MSNWSTGYVAEIEYTFGYYAELNPARIILPLLNQGWCIPKITNACELGFGQGLSVNIHAANSNVTWYGTDFNPSQAACARDLAATAGVGAKLFDQSFAEFVARDDLPEFDYIGLHGIWSWVSEENRQHIVDFMRRKLSVGGIVYVSYNTLPGWAAFAPLRHLMSEHTKVIGSEGRGIVSRIDEALIFAENLVKTNPLYSRANPSVADRIKTLKGQNRNYLAHEYFNKDWHPMHFSTMAEYLDSAKLSYAGSAYFLDNIDNINMTQEQQSFLNELPDRMLRESVRDFIVNQQFRRDYWIKGPRRIDPIQQKTELREARVILLTPRHKVDLKVNAALGDANMSEVVYNPLLDLLADHQIKTIGWLEQQIQAHDVSFAQLIQALIVLGGANHVTTVQRDCVIEASLESSDRLNSHILSRSLGSTDLSYLGSPVTGGGIQVSRVQQFFISAIKNNYSAPDEWAHFAWDALAAMNQRLLKDGEPLESAEDNIVELKRQAEDFRSNWVPVMKVLKIL